MLYEEDLPMPFVQVLGTDVNYALLAFDERGTERTDDPDGLMSRKVLETVAQDPITDAFVMSHGWKGDVAGAREQYSAWVRAMAMCEADRQRAHQRPGYRPLIVGLHWPSLPWGDEDFAEPGVPFSVGASPSAEAWVETYAHRIANTLPAREALQTLFTTVQRDPAPLQLPPDVLAAYAVLDREAGLGSDGEGVAPGDDREPLDAEERYQLARQEAAVSFGIGDIRGTILSPLQQLSFWKMKDRARRFGESGGHDLLRRLLAARDGLRVHLMGHSFGCIVVSAAVAGPVGGLGLPRPVQSLVLVQGAMSLWSYCSDIPFRRGRAGYFRPVMSGNHVAGPVVTTRSTFDTAVGRWYPLGAGVARQLDFAPGELPRYGGVGAYGLQGPGLDLVDLQLERADQSYPFQSGHVFNLECSGVIRNGGGASGAHSDIAHPEVAHALWSAALA
jgi:hypothetical protein